MGLLCMRFLFLKENKNIKGGNITRAMINTDTHHLHLSLPAQRMHLCVVYTEPLLQRIGQEQKTTKQVESCCGRDKSAFVLCTKKSKGIVNYIQPHSRQLENHPPGRLMIAQHITYLVLLCGTKKKEPQPSHRYRKIVGFLFHFFKYLIVHREEKGTITQQRNQHVVPSTLYIEKMKRVRSLSSKFLLHKRVKTHFLYNHFLPINVFCVWLQNNILHHHHIDENIYTQSVLCDGVEPSPYIYIPFSSSTYKNIT